MTIRHYYLQGDFSPLRFVETEGEIHAALLGNISRRSFAISPFAVAGRAHTNEGRVVRNQLPAQAAAPTVRDTLRQRYFNAPLAPLMGRVMRRASDATEAGVSHTPGYPFALVKYSSGAAFTSVLHDHLGGRCFCSDF